MSNTATIRKSHTGFTSVIEYANNETAMIGRTAITSYPLHSTAISYWHYNPATNELVVCYTDGDTYYTYEGVLMRTVFAMFTADSLGAFIATEVKPNHKVRKGVS
jgi:hypothetical protein